MSDMNPSRLGQANLTGAADALFMKLYAAEVLTAFNKTNIMQSKHFMQSIDKGKSFAFPIIGGIGARYHVPGTQILGQNVAHSEKVLTVDELLISDAFIANIDEAKNHYEVRSRYSTAMGEKLANIMDFNILVELIKAARAAAIIPSGDGGSVIESDKLRVCAGGAATVAEKALAIAEAMFAAALELDSKNAPKNGRYCALRPLDYYALIQNKDAINSLWGGQGSYSDGTITKVAGIEIVPCNHVPSTNTTLEADPNYNAYHNVDATKTVGLVWTNDAVATVKLLDVALEKEYSVMYQGTLMVAKYCVGHGVLRPECAVELALENVTNATA